jgi:hypothetical protein
MARGLAALDERDLTSVTLVLPLQMSTWMRREGIGTLDAQAALLALRDAILEAWAFDQASEPIPLLAGDGRTALMGLAIYVGELVRRASARAHRSPIQVVEEALRLL